ncbi:hypothetical protein M3B41_02390 [Klebsiella quasipneumoniae]|uniref:hypothetical protein n=1 Tax=Klebsiella quasipneumoniae TaxID=1463165 RepID=UPI001C2C89F9|nr:hypothetical protein [Klebsiella quasipneumoniae]MBV0366514.1 hypothetical protein [Klebsiella quasipneumoniae]MDT9768927.1 hypothetical protein [Klebsiella quasipneumoniae]MDZ3148451.1 hypothetical protein [Klebsiella quasipneumoniae]MDZ3186733.1 hypothetical protein [Klebsiella quasipneumoniae]
MTDITELAQSLKAAANTTADAIDRLKAFPGDELIDLSQHEGEQVDIDITTLNEWYELSSPANVLALVEALEGRNALVALQKIEIRELNAELEKAQQCIAELESRTVKLPHRNLGHPKLFLLCPFPYYDAEDMDKALAAADIKVEAE